MILLPRYRKRVGAVFIYETEEEKVRVTIETERLILRPITVEDAEAVFKWASDPEVSKFMIYPRHRDISDTTGWLESIDHDNPDNYEMAFVLKETGEVIGSGGIYYRQDEDYWNIGYNIRKDQWGKGLVPEAMQALVDHVRETRNARAIRGSFAKENKKSGRVMEKLGMTYLKEGEYTKFDGSVTFPCYYYERIF